MIGHVKNGVHNLKQVISNFMLNHVPTGRASLIDHDVVKVMLEKYHLLASSENADKFNSAQQIIMEIFGK